VSTNFAFRNQRPAFRNPSPPYQEKILDHPRWIFPSRKNGRQVACWTAGEFQAVVAFEAAAPVMIHSYEERPEVVVLRDGPELYRYTPNFLVELSSGLVIVELSALGEPRTWKQGVIARLAREHYSQRRIKFVEIAHRKLRAQPRAGDAALLVRYLSAVPTSTEVMRARDVLSAGPASIAQVEVAAEVRRECLLAMVRRGELALVDLPPITLESRLSICDAGAPR